MAAIMTLTFAGSTSIPFDYGAAVGIQKEFIKSEDGTVLSEKHTVTIKGAIVSTDGTDGLARYTALVTKGVDIVRKKGGAERAANLVAGSLVLTAGGGDAFANVYTSAFLTGASLSEPSDDTAGIQFQEVSLTFECFVLTGITYNLKAASEQFEIKRDEDQLFYGNAAGAFTGDSDNPYYGFIITHTLSATGQAKVGNDNSEAYNEASKYIDAKKKSSLLGVIISKDAQGGNLYNKFNTNKFGVDSGGDYDFAGTAAVGDTPATGYQEYNRTSTETKDLAGGSCSLTRTYFYSNAPFLIDITGSYEKSEDSIDMIKVDGTVTGLSSKDYKDKNHDKYTKAKAGFDVMKGTGNPFGKGSPLYKFADKIFGDNKYSTFYSANMILDDRPISSSVGENKVKGTIQFSVGYKPLPTEVLGYKKQIPECIAINITVTEENKPFTVNGVIIQQQTVVPVMILGRKKGPILQDMKTTKESTKTVQIEATVDIAQRYKDNTSVVASGLAVALSHAPTEGNSFLTTLTHNWDWAVGKLTFNAGWIYTK
jgi:hypothetical protein